VINVYNNIIRTRW